MELQRIQQGTGPTLEQQDARARAAALEVATARAIREIKATYAEDVREVIDADHPLVIDLRDRLFNQAMIYQTQRSRIRENPMDFELLGEFRDIGDGVPEDIQQVVDGDSENEVVFVEQQGPTAASGVAQNGGDIPSDSDDDNDSLAERLEQIRNGSVRRRRGMTVGGRMARNSSSNNRTNNSTQNRNITQESLQNEESYNTDDKLAQIRGTTRTRRVIVMSVRKETTATMRIITVALQQQQPTMATT